MKKIFLSVFALISIQFMYGQGGYGSMTYSIGFPTGNMKDYIDQISYRGINLELFWHTNKSFDAGIEVGWNTFYAKENEKTYTQETQSITGTQFRYINAVPMIAGARWRKPGGKTQPYFGAGVGTTYLGRATDFGLYRITNNNWQFCVRPEAGLIYRLSDATGATVGVKYYANFKTDNLDAQTFLTVNVGFVFGLSKW
jgi:outer membrane protein W